MASRLQNGCDKLLKIAEELVDGFYQEDAEKHFEDRELFISSLNNLLVKARLHIKREPESGKHVFYFVEADIADKLVKHNKQEVDMYHMIAECGDRGIWTRTLTRHGLPKKAVDKMFKGLERSGLVRLVDTHETKMKKFYIRADVTPSPLLTGGDFYNGGAFDEAFAVKVSDLCIEYCEAQKGDKEKVILQGACEYVNVELKELKLREVSSKGVSQALGCLVLDGLLELHEQKKEGSAKDIAVKVQSSSSSSSSSVLGKRSRQDSSSSISDEAEYRTNSFKLQEGESVAYQIPCCSCPVAKKCQTGGVVSPENCQYMPAWLGKPNVMENGGATTANSLGSGSLLSW